MSIAQLLLAELDREVEASRALLDRLPEGKWDWRPHAKSMILSRLATHVAESPSWSNAILMADEIDFMSPEMQAWTPREMQSKAEILAELESAAETCRGHLAQLGVYLRLLDVPLPMTYGPSADEGGGMGE